MAKSPKRYEEERAVKMTAIRIEREVNELLRKGAAIRGETIVGYANRIMREFAEADILAESQRVVAEAEAKKRSDKPKS